MTQTKISTKACQFVARSSPPLALPPKQIRWPSLSFTCSVILHTFLISSWLPLLKEVVLRVRVPICPVDEASARAAQDACRSPMDKAPKLHSLLKLNSLQTETDLWSDANSFPQYSWQESQE